MSVPLRFAPGDSCEVGGQRGIVQAIIGSNLAEVKFGGSDELHRVPLVDLDIALPKLGPTVRRGKSKQDFETPPDFMTAIIVRFGPIVVDLAASAANKKATEWFDEELDSLSMPWAEKFPTGNAFLNPEFADIAPWAEKCAAESRNRQGRILLLTPASVSTNWFADHVFGKAMVHFLSPRITFVGAKDPYPRDLMLSVYGDGANGFGCWRWKP